MELLPTEAWANVPVCKRHSEYLILLKNTCVCTIDVDITVCLSGVLKLDCSIFVSFPSFHCSMQWFTDLGGDYSVVRKSLLYKGLGARGRLLVSNVNGPGVHPVVFTYTLQGHKQEDSFIS